MKYLLAVIVLVVALAGCGGDDDAHISPAASTTKTVEQISAGRRDNLSVAVIELPDGTESQCVIYVGGSGRPAMDCKHQEEK